MDFDNYKGYAPFSRSLLFDPIIRNKGLWQLFTYLLLKVNFKDGYAFPKSKKIFVPKGSTVTGRLRISGDLDIPPTTVDSRLNALLEAGYITMKRNNEYSIITVINYDQIASFCQEVDSQLASNKHLTDTNNNDNNDNDEKNVKKKY